MIQESLAKSLRGQSFVIVRSLVILLLLGVTIYIGAAFWVGWQQIVFVFNQLGVTVLVTGGAVASQAYVLRFGRWLLIPQTN